MHLLSVQNLSFSWGYKPLFNELGFNLDKGQTIGIAGPNGCGKSSLVKILGGSLSPDRGQLALAPGSRVATVAQNPDFGAALTIRDCLLAETRQLADRLRTLEEAMAATTDESRMPALLARFGEAQGAFLAAGGYQADEQAERLLARTGLPLRPDQALTTLSGGERSVLSLVQALVADPDLLILDEPGNHLDYQGLAWLEAFLAELDKGIILVSHNRYLLDRVAGTIIYLEAGRHWIHRGSYSDFRQMRREQLAEERKAHAARERELQQLTLALKDLQAQAAQSYNPPARVMSDLAVTKRKIAELR